jgi:hypothetical protein
MYKVRIKRLPMAAEGMQMGNQMGHGFHVGGGKWDAGSSGRQRLDGVRSFLPEVDRIRANVEAEKGEGVMGNFNGDGIPEFFKVGGKRHSQGGTPLSVPDGSFVFSDTKRMRIGGPVLELFGKSGKKKYTPAQLAKPYQVNRFQALLQNSDSDRLDKDTAALMLQNSQDKLAKLALLQEAMKGFPQGVPSISIPWLQRSGLLSEDNSVEPVEDAGSLMPAPSTGLVKAQYGFNARYPFLFPNGASFVRDPQLADDSSVDALQATTLPPVVVTPKTRSLYGKDVFVTDARGKKVLLPAYLQGNTKAQVPLVQQKRKDGTYGIQDWNMGDFYERHPWVKELRPGFDVANADDVRWFQSEYNKRYEDIWKTKYFNGMGHRKIDGHFGQGTFSTPAVTEVPNGATPAKKEEEKKKDNLLPNDFEPVLGEEDIKVGWTPQDEFNVFATLRNLLGIERVGPGYVGAHLKAPGVAFYDPARALAANQEAAAVQEMTAGLYGDPRLALGTNRNQVSTAAGILSQVQNENVNAANQAANVQADVFNKEAFANAVAKKTYQDESATLRQQYLNSLAAADESVRANVVNGMTNAQKFYWLNKMNEQFQIDPSSSRLFFKKGRNFSASSGSTGSSNPLALYKAYYQQYLKDVSNDPAAAKEFALKAAFATKGGGSADMMAMLQQYAG